MPILLYEGAVKSEKVKPSALRTTNMYMFVAHSGAALLGNCVRYWHKNLIQNIMFS